MDGIILHAAEGRVVWISRNKIGRPEEEGSPGVHRRETTEENLAPYAKTSFTITGIRTPEGKGQRKDWETGKEKGRRGWGHAKSRRLCKGRDYLWLESCNQRRHGENAIKRSHITHRERRTSGRGEVKKNREQGIWLTQRSTEKKVKRAGAISKFSTPRGSHALEEKGFWCRKRNCRPDQEERKKH